MAYITIGVMAQFTCSHFFDGQNSDSLIIVKMSTEIVLFSERFHFRMHLLIFSKLTNDMWKLCLKEKFNAEIMKILTESLG